MPKKAKEKNLDLFHSNSKSKKNKKNLNNNKDTKEEKFGFNEEVFIGLKRIDNKTEINKKNNSKNKTTKKIKEHKEKKKVPSKTKSGNNRNDDIIVKDIYSKQNKVQKQPKKKNNKKKVEHKLTKKEQIARQKRKAILKVTKWTTLIVIIIIGIIYTLLSPIFNITNINVVGNSIISKDEIISLSKIEIQNNMFKYKTAQIIDNIKQNAYIENVTVNRKIPDCIELVIEERNPTYMIKIANAYAYINNQGYILEISDKKLELPILTGIETIQEEIYAGNRLCMQDLKKLGDVLKIMESAMSNEISKLITSIDITNISDYILKLDSNKKTVYLGDISNLSTKMLWIIKFNEEEKNTTGEIFLNMNLNNENAKPYFRKKI